jgi:hypothetical protein
VNRWRKGKRARGGGGESAGESGLRINSTGGVGERENERERESEREKRTKRIKRIKRIMSLLSAILHRHC